MLALNKAAMVLAAGCIGLGLGACGQSTSKSSSNEQTAQKQQQDQADYQPTPSVPVAIDESNSKALASYTLKSVVLTDVSTSALDTAVSIAGNQNAQVANLATGVVLNLKNIPCGGGGSFSLDMQVEDSSSDVQLDFSNQLSVLLATTFADCAKSGHTLSGDVRLDFNAYLEDLVNYDRFNFETHVGTDELVVTQTGYQPFTMEGQFHYKVSSDDGVVSTTTVETESGVFFADDVYQVQQFQSVKEVDASNMAYSFTSVGQLEQSTQAASTLVEFETLEPLQGVGFSKPHAGTIAVSGEDETLFIDVIDSQQVLLSLDEGNDGEVDYEEYATWEDLVLNHIAADSN